MNGETLRRLPLLRATSSHLPLLERCAYVGRPDVEVPADEEREDAKRGHARHRAYAAAITGRPVAAEDLALGGIDVDHLENVVDWFSSRFGFGDLYIAAEVKYAYAPLTGTARELFSDGARDYSEATREEICGSADVVITDGETITIIDWKSGAAHGVDRAQRNAQLRSLALYATRDAGKHITNARVVIAFVQDDGTVRTSEAMLSLDDLVETAAAITRTLESFEGAEPVAGAWCAEKFCPLRGTCPAHVAAIGELVPTAQAPGLAIASPGQARYALELVDRVESRLAAVKAELRRWADEHGGIPVEGGVWGRREIKRDHLQLTAAARRVLDEQLGDAASGAITESISKASVARAVKLVAVRGQGDAMEKRILEALRAADAVSTETDVTYAVRRGAR